MTPMKAHKELLDDLNIAFFLHNYCEFSPLHALAICNHMAGTHNACRCDNITPVPLSLSLLELFKYYLVK